MGACPIYPWSFSDVTFLSVTWWLMLVRSRLKFVDLLQIIILEPHVSIKRPTFFVGPCWPVEATGKTMETYVHSHQDKSRNAMSKALEASFVAWVEELRADQAQFSSEKVLSLCLFLFVCVYFLFDVVFSPISSLSWPKICIIYSSPQLFPHIIMPDRTKDGKGGCQGKEQDHSAAWGLGGVGTIEHILFWKYEICIPVIPVQKQSS